MNRIITPSHSMTTLPSLAISGFLVASGLAACGYFIGHGISDRGSNSRYVSVKGLSEREVSATLAIWNLSYKVAGNDLNGVHSELAKSTQAVLAFLKARGFDDLEISIQPPSIRDHSFDYRDKDDPPPPNRFSSSQSVLLRTNKVNQLKPAVGATSDLMQQGVFLSSVDDPQYSYEKLNDIKPEMIEEATRNAREAGTRFARDSEVQLGKLRTASQGWFQVENRDVATPEIKRVRVVVEVDFSID
jgi:hypothetical protein